MKIKLLLLVLFIYKLVFSQTITLTYDRNGNRLTKQINTNAPVARITGDTVACRGNIAQLTASGGGTYQWVNGPSQSTYSFVADSSRNYSVVVTNTAGCKDTAVQQVKVVTPPATVNVSGDTVVNINQLVTYSIPAVPFASYVWTVTNGNILTRLDSNAVTVKWAGSPGLGSVKVTVRIGASCERIMPTLPVRISTATGIRPETITSFGMYPNPSHDWVNIDMQLKKPAPVQLKVFNSLGTPCFDWYTSNITSEHQIRLPRSFFGAAGVYLIHFIIQEEFFTSTIVII